MTKLKERYGALLDSSSFHFGDEIPTPLRLANQFAHIHEHVKAANCAQDSGDS
jgi:hypothetical protein